MSDSDESIDENEIEETQEDKADRNDAEKNIDRKNLPRHLKKRYWNSIEEQRLVELWRLHFNEIVDLEHNLPIFRTISAGMRESGFHMNAQEIRRKIKYIKNKYIGESRRLAKPREANKESEWRLYRLVHCMMAPRQQKPDLFWELKQLAEIVQEKKNNQLYQLILSGAPILEETVDRIERGETIDIPQPISLELNFPIENKMVAASIAVGYKNKHKLSFTPRVFRHNEEVAAQAQMIEQAVKALSSKNGISDFETVPLASSPPPKPSIPLAPTAASLNQHQSKIQQPGILCGQGILKRNATISSLQQIRAENRQLMEQVLIEGKRLKQEELKLKNYELTIAQVERFYESIFQKLEIDNV